MNVVEKRNFIFDHLHLANETIINEFYKKLVGDEVVKAKLVIRAKKSEDDIRAGRVFSRVEAEQRTGNAIRE